LSLSSRDARRTFIEFFKAKPAPGQGHVFVPPSPVVPHDDPTLLFTNAGMNQFKPLFLGQVAPGTPLYGLRRAVNSQKCIRAGGKHNDLEDVGRDTYHHTFFEMLGNWSFGDYFKAESIAWGYELLVKVFGIDPSRLYATYFRGDPAAGLEPDLESRALWEALLPPGHVLPGGMKDNFWEMGETGPCGPCSEIHYDRVGERDASSLVNTGDPDVIEIWNHVFIQFNRDEAGSLRPLPARHVDTGMGLERLVSVLQNVNSNYDTDIFAPLFVAIERLTKAPPYRGRLGDDEGGRIDTAYRVIADHVRMLTFAINDGATPSNVGRGYVVRRVLRRASRFARQRLNAPPGLLAQLVPVVVEHMADAFPELAHKPDRIVEIVRAEEESFGRTLDRGIKLFEQVAAAAVDGRISGADAFRLYDTFGFPIDLTALMARERGLAVDMEGYEAQRARAEEISRAGAARTAAEILALDAGAVERLQRMGVAPTRDYDKFEARNISARVEAIWNGDNFDNHVRTSTAGNTLIGIILDRTNFYAEMGGQVGDHGRLILASEVRGDSPQHGEFKVEDTRAFAGYILHIGHLVRGEIRVGDRVMAHVDHARRTPTENNHTATHLLNLALRKVLGDECHQKGSYVGPDRARFDFSHPRPVTPAEIERIETIVREHIARDLTVYAQLADLARARAIEGIRAVFGETYPDPVRVVSIGQPVSDLLESPSNPAWREISVELCGGTHAPSTARLGAVAILSEEAIAKGIRRVVAVTGVPAEAAIQAADDAARRIHAAEFLPPDALAAEAQAIAQAIDQFPMPLARKAQLRADLTGIQERARQYQKQQQQAARDAAVAAAQAIAAGALNADDDVIVNVVPAGDDRAALQAAVQALRQACPRAAVMLFSIEPPEGPDARIALAAAVPQAMIQRGLKAGDWVREAAAVCGGKGGGKPDQAQGGGSDASKVRPAIAAARAYALRFLK
jgi:alanyl-tRNA synthetase